MWRAAASGGPVAHEHGAGTRPKANAGAALTG